MIQELNFQFDVNKIRTYFESIKQLGSGSQVSLTTRPNQPLYTDGCGSAIDPKNPHKLLFTEADFSELVEGANNPMFDVISNVKQIALEQFNLSIGRIRFMTLRPKTCLSYHKDTEEIRFHIPIYTNRACFFVVDDIVYRMLKEGTLYTLRTNHFHTPINANRTFERTHLVFSTSAN